MIFGPVMSNRSVMITGFFFHSAFDSLIRSLGFRPKGTQFGDTLYKAPCRQFWWCKALVKLHLPELKQLLLHL